MRKNKNITEEHSKYNNSHKIQLLSTNKQYLTQILLITAVKNLLQLTPFTRPHTPLQ